MRADHDRYAELHALEQAHDAAMESDGAQTLLQQWAGQLDNRPSLLRALERVGLAVRADREAVVNARRQT